MLQKTNAQSCNGNYGAPVVSETFGAGKIAGLGPELPTGTTSMIYHADDCGGPIGIDESSGLYTITTYLGSSCRGTSWQIIPHDHTGDKNGYFMLVNASIAPSIFYQQKIAGNKLCPNTTYFFGAYLMNLLRALPTNIGLSQPNITFRIETTSGQVLSEFNTGNLPQINENDPVVFKQYGGTFTTTSAGGDLVLKLINNAPGGNGNDFAMDDITLSPCGPVIEAGFNTVADTTSRSACSNADLNYTLVSAFRDYVDPTYQWQQNYNDGKGWVNIAGANSASFPLVLNNTAAGTYQYRIGLLNKAQTGSEACRIYSNPLNINVYNYPPKNLLADISVCIDQPLVLSAGGGDDYQWSGPNNFTSTESSPTVTSEAKLLDNGIYTLRVFNHGCPIFEQTTVTVFPKSTVAALPNVTICAGNSVQLHAISTNANHYKWRPAAGLDHDDVANPIANPSITTVYSVAVNNDSCPDVTPTTSFTITVLQKPGANAGSAQKITEGESVQLNGKITGDSVSYYWSPATSLSNANVINPTANPTADIIYTLHAVSKAGCGESTSAVFIRVFRKLTLPNSFTPNGDGINDFWNIKNIDSYPQASVDIYNRYGTLVYHSIGYNKAWDGSFNNAPLNVGTYYYVVDLKEDALHKISGWLLLIR